MFDQSLQLRHKKRAPRLLLATGRSNNSHTLTMKAAVTSVSKLTQKNKDRFWAKVQVCGNNECWPWMAHRDKDGYGNVKVKNTAHRAHRISFIIANGFLSLGLFVLHKCDNPCCVNPKHLWAGTCMDNAQDLVRKKRGIHGERQHSSKLNPRAVRKIRNLYRQRIIPSQRKLAAKFGVCRRSVIKILRGVTWKHVK